MKSMPNTSTQRGFTLVELMITITLLTIILMMGSSLSRSWIDRSQVTNAMTVFKSSVAQAQAIALRNTNNHPITQASVSVCWDETNHIMRIIRVDTASNNVCQTNAQNTVLQSFSLPKGLAIKQGTTAFQCISFNSAGVVTVATSSGCISDTKTAFKVGKNNETADISLI
jgi:type IV pilus assembly protein PilA